MLNVSIDSEQVFLVRRICEYILRFKADIEAELSASIQGKKEFFKVRSVFRHEDCMVDEKACSGLGVLLGNKSSLHELQMVCGIGFQGKGVKREVGVSLVLRN